MATPAEIDTTNRRLALQMAVQLGYSYKEPTPIDNARAFLEFLNEADVAPEKPPTGFMPQAPTP